MNRLDAELNRLYLGGLVFAPQDAQSSFLQEILYWQERISDK